MARRSSTELIKAPEVLTAAQVRRLYATLAIVLRRPKTEQARVLNRLEQLIHERIGAGLSDGRS